MRIPFPMPHSVFQSQYYEQKFVYLERAIPQVAYTWDDFSKEFFGIDAGDRRIRLFNDGEVNKNQYTTLAQDGNHVRTLYKPGVINQKIESGATVVVNNFEKSSEYVAAICDQYAELTGGRCAGNAYVANGGDGTFGKHWDTHCVFATQLLGKKLWRVYKPTQDLPLQFQTSKEVKHECGNDPVFERIIEPGDILYIPRGWWHEAIPIENTPTLHIAAGIYTTKIFEYLRWIVESRAPKILSARMTIQFNSNNEVFQSVAAELSKEILSLENKEEFIVKHIQSSQKYVHIDFRSIFQNANRS